MSEQSQYVFITKLSNEQKNYLTSLLPLRYSFQPGTVSTNKNVVKKMNNFVKEEIVVQKQIESKRRKPKAFDVPDVIEKKPVLSQKDQIFKKSIIIKKLKKHDSSWPFRFPVDPKLLLIPNYNEIVLVPMDLQAIEEKIKNQKYEHPSEIERDINQMFLNSYKFNSKDSQYFEATSKLEQYYQNLLQDNEDGLTKKELPDRQKKKQENHTTHSHENQKANQISEFQRDLTSLLKRANELSNQKPVRHKPIYVSSKNEGALTLKQKRELAQQFKSMDESHLNRMIEIMKHTSKEGHFDLKIDQKTDIVNIDLQKLDSRTLRELQNYIRLQKNSILHDHESSMLDSQENMYSVC